MITVFMHGYVIKDKILGWAGWGWGDGNFYFHNKHEYSGSNFKTRCRLPNTATRITL